MFVELFTLHYITLFPQKSLHLGVYPQKSLHLGVYILHVLGIPLVFQILQHSGLVIHCFQNYRLHGSSFSLQLTCTHDCQSFSLQVKGVNFWFSEGRPVATTGAAGCSGGVLEVGLLCTRLMYAFQFCEAEIS